MNSYGVGIIVCPAPFRRGGRWLLTKSSDPNTIQYAIPFCSALRSTSGGGSLGSRHYHGITYGLQPRTWYPVPLGEGRGAEREFRLHEVHHGRRSRMPVIFP